MPRNDQTSFHDFQLPLPQPMVQNCMPHSITNDCQRKEHVDKYDTTLSKLYQSTISYHLYEMNFLTSIDDILTLIDLVSKTSLFSLHTEQSYKGDQPSWSIRIQLMPIPPLQLPTTLLLFQVDPSVLIDREIFCRIQTLLQTMFVSEKTFYAWEYHAEHLRILLDYYYLTSYTLDHLFIITLQNRFQQWYNQTFPQTHPCPTPSLHASDAILCTGPYRSDNILSNDRWSIENAIKSVFQLNLIKTNEEILPLSYLDTTYTVNICSALLDLAIIIGLEMTFEP